MRTALLFIVLVVLSSCSKKTTVVDIPQPKPIEDAIIMEYEPEEPLKELDPPVPEPKTRIITIYFEYDSYAIPEYEKEKLNNINGSPSLKGAASPEGSDEYNYELGLKRAYSVREALENKGIHILNCISVGEKELVSENYELDRRCEISF